MENAEKIRNFLASEDSVFVHYPNGNLIDEHLSNDFIDFSIKNNATTSSRVVIFDGGYDTRRVSKVFNGIEYWNHDFTGRLPIMSNVPPNLNLDMIELNDDFTQINRFTGINARAVLTNSVCLKQQDVGIYNGNFISVGSRKSLDLLRQMPKFGALRIAEIEIQTTNINQFSRKIGFFKASPFKKYETAEIKLERFNKPEASSVSKKIIIDTKIIIAPNTLMYIDVESQTEITVTMKISAYFDTEKALKEIIKPQLLNNYLNK